MLRKIKNLVLHVSIYIKTSAHKRVKLLITVHLTCDCVRYNPKIWYIFYHSHTRIHFWGFGKFLSLLLFFFNHVLYIEMCILFVIITHCHRIKCIPFCWLSNLLLFYGTIFVNSRWAFNFLANIILLMKNCIFKNQ